MRWIWLGAGWAAVTLAILGIFLPLLPTTPFLLLAAALFARGSPRLHVWLLAHPRLGPPILDWQMHGSISTRAKSLTLVAMGVAFLITLLLRLPGWILLVQLAVLLAVAGFILSRPGPPPGAA
ncbi:hypothetical protein SAMN07250955_101233 [Arboricoccus pini]|uniref:Inner membrane protein n=1 Tax=Arboricoccus pini TaxID=1963835 RepID=A0A212PYZ3_9PROT|nr:DUF454 family protein [Arboricoccus pini]SNB52341.1 hypothetical protein SAMN07250955_101233 [Arboricoccus pini]